MKWLIAIKSALISALVAGCGSNPAPPFTPVVSFDPIVSKGEIAQVGQNAASIYRECIIANVSRLDDNESDARTIARAAVSACREERLLMTEVTAMEYGVSRSEVHRLYQGSLADAIDAATEVVLDRRR